MKRIISIAACVVLAILAVSCQKDDLSGKEQKTVFSVVIPNEGQTRADVSDGSLVDKLYYEVYVGGDIMYKGDVTATAGYNPRQFAVEMNLVKGVEYQILFWAQCSGQNFYSWETLKGINVSYAGNANDEKRDAFYAKLPKYTVTDNPTTVYLTRPFAQVNFGSSASDWNAALPFVTTDNGFNLLSKVVMKNLPTRFDVSTGDIVSGYTTNANEDVVFDFSQAPVAWASYNSDIVNANTNETYKRVAMTYILAPAGDVTNQQGMNIGTVKAYFVHNKNTQATALEKTVDNVPARQNFRTNILGNVFSGGNQFTVIVSPGFTDDYVL